MDIKIVSAYDKDITFLQQFLQGRAPCLALDSSDIRRAERMLEQLATVHDRPLYKTIKGHGVFSIHPGEKDWPVVRVVNEAVLDRLIRELKPPPMQPDEIEAVDIYFEQLSKTGNWLNTQMGDLSSQGQPSYHGGKVEGDPSPAGIPDFPQPMEIPFNDWNDLFVPMEVHPKEATNLKLETYAILADFLLRFRIMVRNSSGDFQTRINPIILDPSQAGDNGTEAISGNYIGAQQWLGGKDIGHEGVRGQVGVQYGVDAGDEGPPPIKDCLDMIAKAIPDSNIIFLMEGFKSDLPDEEGRTQGSGGGDPIRDLEAAIRELEGSANQVVVMSPGSKWSATSVANLIQTYMLNRPDIEDLDELVRTSLAITYSTMEALYWEVVNNIIHRGESLIDPEELQELQQLPKNEKDNEVFDIGLLSATNALRGLTESRALELVWMSIRSSRDLDPDLLDGARQEIIRNVAGLTLVEPSVSFDNVGGLDALKTWINERGIDLFLTPEQSKKAGLGGEVYKGILLIGLPGTGKSLITKAIANELQKIVGKKFPVSLIQLDTGALRGKYVGTSEAKTDEALATVDAFAPVVLWIDEIEKAFAGAGGEDSGEGGGVGTRMLGKFLTWMQERKSPVFLVATSNDISKLPPEFTREGRFDAKFYTPLPDRKACVAILKFNLRKFDPSLTLKKILSNTMDLFGDEQKAQYAFINWVNYASAMNSTGEPEPVYVNRRGDESNPKPRKDKEGGLVTRHQGFSGAEIEQAVKRAIIKARGIAEQNETDWRDEVTFVLLLQALQGKTPVSRGFAQTGQRMADLMVDLESQAEKLLTAEEIAEQEKKVYDMIQNQTVWTPDGPRNISSEDVDELMAAVGELSKVVKSNAKKKKKKKTTKKGRRRRNPKNQDTYLLGSDFWS